MIRYSGILALWRFVHRGDVLILVGHGTAPQMSHPQWIPLRPQLRPAMLERSLRLLTRHYRLLGFEQATAIIAGRAPLEQSCAAVTFDDGYRNNLACAVPVLRRYQARPIIYLTTGHIERRTPFWFDRLDFALQAGLQLNGRTLTVGAEALKLRTGTRAEMASSYAQLRQVAKAAIRPDTTMLAELDSIAESLELEAGRKLADIFEQDGFSGVVTWEEVRAATADVDFGSHTANHIRVPLVNAEEAEQELVDSKQQIERAIDTPCRHFAYPDGSFSREAADLVRAAGYTSAVTMEPGLNRVGDDLMQLKRIPFPLQGSDSELLLELSGFMHWFTSLLANFSKGKKT
jgi:peptidoglycan/xylan/chitin deacetylase (PgdA/CDA1 family)